MFLLLPAVLLSGGCLPEEPPEVATQPAPESFAEVRILGDPDGATTRPADKRYVLIVRLRIASIEVPLGTASGTERLWSYLNEEAFSSARTAGLGRNGFRAGTAMGDAWEDLARVFKEMTGRKLREQNINTLPGRPTHMFLKEAEPLRTIFLSHADRTLSGEDFPPGDYLLGLSVTLNEDDPSRLLVTGWPVIRSTHRETRFVRRNGQPVMVTEPLYFPLAPLQFQAQMDSGDLLVIGPGAASRRPTSAGRRFLVKRKEGMDFETVLVIVPEVFATPMR